MLERIPTSRDGFDPGPPASATHARLPIRRLALPVAGATALVLLSAGAALACVTPRPTPTPTVTWTCAHRDRCLPTPPVTVPAEDETMTPETTPSETTTPETTPSETTTPETTTSETAAAQTTAPVAHEAVGEGGCSGGSSAAACNVVVGSPSFTG